MKISELKELLNQSNNDEEVSIALADPSIGPRAMSSVKCAYYGFDWESGHLILIPTKNLTAKGYKQEVFDLAHNLIYKLSKPEKFKIPINLQKLAQKILDKAKQKIDNKQ